MKCHLIICFAIVHFSTYLFGQTVPSDKNINGHTQVLIHKQSGKIIPLDEVYNYRQYGGTIYTFKISRDTTYQYLDEDPPEDFNAYFNSILSEKLNKPGILDSIQDLK